MSQSSIEPHALPLCDIVMEGGVTSGVVYPKAVVELSERFRIKNIGGTSAGAIAAAATAAAELGRLRDPATNPGYKRLAGVADELSGKGFSAKDSTRLLDLFQPQERTRPLFVALVSALNRQSKWGLAGGLALGAVRGFRWPFWGAFAVPIVLAFVNGHHDAFTWVITLFLGVLAGAIAVGYSIWCCLKGPMVDNGYGICKGYGAEADKLAPGDVKEPLTLWLSRLLNDCAGKSPDDPPLTFGELWAGTDDTKSAPPDWLQLAGLTKWHYVDLQVMTTNVTHGRPYRFPFKDDDQHLYFKASELAEWFPTKVIEHMVKHARDYAKHRHEGEPQTLPAGTFMLPEPEKLPVVFATRLSLSFPFLLCAVPLYATDFEHTVPEKRRIERCWFSDGGICSNFPIHFFDAPLPMWPTFGIKLESELTRYRHIAQDLNAGASASQDENRFFLPTKNEDGRADSWLRFDEGNNGGQKLLGFVAGLLDAARNWRDRMLTRAPGVRDRVVRVYLKDTEGGLNLNMKPDLVTGLSAIGERAAQMLAERFTPGANDPMNFDNHRWVRLRNLAAVLEQDLGPVHRAIVMSPPLTKDWEILVGSAIGQTNVDKYPIDAGQAAKLSQLIKDLNVISQDASKVPTMLDKNAPKRTPVIRIVPNV